MYQFRLLSTVVKAARIDTSGAVTLDGHTLIGDAGTWIVVDAHGVQSTWTNEAFRKNFEPANKDAEAYLNSVSDA